MAMKPGVEGGRDALSLQKSGMENSCHEEFMLIKAITMQKVFMTADIGI